jgi:translation initiation factor 3 subunit F
MVSSSTTPALLIPSNSTGTGLAETEAVNCAVVHPLVLLSVLDHHTRRQEGAGRVIGTLLGRRDGEKVEVTNCFPIPHAERDEEVAIGKDFNRQMLALHLRCNPNETVVGWYATAFHGKDQAEDEPSSFSSITDISALIHDFYANECDESVIESPIHLFVDTSLVSDSIALKAYKSSAITLRGEALANMFHEVRLVLKSTESERLAVNEMIAAQESDESKESSSSASENNTLQCSMEKLLEMLDTASEYVDNVVDGKIPADDDVGRQIADTLSSVPRIRSEVFDKMFNDSLQDLLMVTYLSNVTKTQLTIAEKLNASLDQNSK